MSSNPFNLSWEMPRKPLEKTKFGWKPDLPDHRDFTYSQAGGLSTKITKLPTICEIPTTFFSPVEDQRSLGSCTANAAASLIEYMQKRAKGVHVDVSRLFLYKVTRKLMGEVGDTGAYLRDTMKAMRLFGALPEEYWPYDTVTYEAEPTAYQYAIAGNFKSVSYFRVDQGGLNSTDLMLEIKSRIFKKLPLMFGFTCFSSLNTAIDGNIPFPTSNERVIGGHAVALIGYNDERKAFKIRNSWGTQWGDKGYGYLPYEYLNQGLMTDIWGIIKQEWIDTGEFN